MRPSVHLLAGRTLASALRIGGAALSLLTAVGCTAPAHPPATAASRPPSTAAAPPATPATAPASAPAGTTAAPAPTAAPLSPRIVDPRTGGLGEVAQAFLARYRVERNRQRAALGPVVVVSGDDLTLMHGETSEKVTVIPPGYHVLKAASHLPFAAWLLLLPATADGGAVDLAGLDALLASIARITSEPASPELTPAQVARQAEIVARSQAFLTGVRARREVSAEDLQAFARTQGPLLLHSADEAGCLQIRGMHAQMSTWRAQLSADEWSRLLVVNRAKKQSRHRSVASQYFGWLLGGERADWSYPGEGDRVLYAEYMSPGDEPLDLLAAVTLDAAAATDFFADPHRLGEDILADGAARCIAELAAAAAGQSSTR